MSVYFIKYENLFTVTFLKLCCPGNLGKQHGASDCLLLC